MLKWKIVKLAMYGMCFLSAVLFVLGISYRFPLINAVGFKLTEYWSLAVFGLIFSVATGIYAAVKTVHTAVLIYRAGKNKNSKNPVNHANSADIVENQTENTLSESEENEGGGILNAEQNADAVTVNTAADKKEERKKSRAQRRREKLLNDKRREKKLAGIFGVVSVIAGIVFGIYFSAWAFFPHKLCFHNYVYNLVENETEPESGEIKSYKFYQSYSGRPYVIYSFGNGEEFRVYLQNTKKGEDENGKFEVYVFSGSHVYGKILDKLRDKYTTVTTEITVKYYVADAHTVISHTAEKKRDGVSETYDYSGKIYSYKNLAH